jgi:hypothetical protein
MSAGWSAAVVRGRGLCRRRLGYDGAVRLATCPTLAAALASLAPTAYGREVHEGMDLADAQHAVSATALWHLRILAGWGPPLGARPLRLLAGGFEVANITLHLARLDGQVVRAPFILGSLALSWPSISNARSASEVRVALRASPWGDPGTEDLGSVRLALEFAWARLVLEGATQAGDWAMAQAAIALAKVLASGALSALGPSARRDATRVLGSRWERATAPGDLAHFVPRSAARVLEGVAGPEDLWRAEARQWRLLEASALALVARTPPGAAGPIGVAGALGADAWRTRAALAVAANGGGDLSEVLDAAA